MKQKSVVFVKTHVMLEEDGDDKAREILEMLDDKLRENGEFTVLAEKEVAFSIEVSRQHYRAHVEKHFHPELETAITQDGGRVLARVYQGKDMIQRIRDAVGATDSSKAKEGTVRHKYGDHNNMTNNAVHASGDEADAEWEIKLHFPELVEEWF